jgi:hypothetical protein
MFERKGSESWKGEGVGLSDERYLSYIVPTSPHYVKRFLQNDPSLYKPAIARISDNIHVEDMVIIAN